MQKTKTVLKKRYDGCTLTIQTILKALAKCHHKDKIVATKCNLSATANAAKDFLVQKNFLNSGIKI